MLIFVLLLLFWLAMQAETLRLRSSMSSQLNNKVSELDRELNQFAVLPRVVAAHPHILQAVLNQTKTALDNANNVLLDVRKSSEAAFAFLMDDTGTTLAADNFDSNVSFVGVNYGFRPYFKRAIKNSEASFFAVGATTGEPGYFVANPVVDNDDAVGVVVIKNELAGLLDSWKQDDFDWMAVDELGVVMLSTKDEFLYAATRKLDQSELQIIAEDRRYSVNADLELQRLSKQLVSRSSNAGSKRYIESNRRLTSEPWTLHIVFPRSKLMLFALYYVLAIAALGSIIWLVYRNYRQQKRLANTEQKHAQELELQVEQRTEELRSAQQALISQSNFAVLGSMSAAINHEINQPLASLRLNLASLRNLFDQSDPNLNEIKQIVIDSDRTTKRIGRVVTTLRSVSRQGTMDFQSIEANRLSEDVAATIRRERPSASETLSFSECASDIRVYGNEVLIQQALLNLLYNALDAVLKVQDPEVRFFIETDDKNVMFLVKDNGHGVASDIKGELFKPFVTDKTRPGGLGLGLTLAKQIAQDHQGELQHKEATPHGSQFSLILPRSNTTE